MKTADVAVIGAGIAGASAAAELAADATVVLLESEVQPGYHATGRSAAFFAAAYGKPIVRELTARSESFFYDPPEDFTEVDLIHSRDCIFFAREDQADRLHAMLEAYPHLEFVDPAAVRARVPIVSRDYLYGGARESRGGDLNVHALLQGFLRQFRRRGGKLYGRHPVRALHRAAGHWRLDAGEEVFEAGLVVNAAGAWADSVAGMAGLEPLGLEPLRRTAFTIEAPEDQDIEAWPAMLDVDEEFYFKPESGRILISPADETPSEACDAHPDDLDVAIGVDRFERATGIDVRKVRHAWAGLRTFAPDRVFVAGFDPREEGFFWLAGQGGYGIQSSPALARFAALLITGDDPARSDPGWQALAREVAPERLLR